MKVSVIGLGQRGFNYLRWISYFDKDVEIAAVCDKNKERADYTQKRYKVKNKFYNENDFFEKCFSEAVIVATQDRDHFNHCMKCIDTGYKFILCEKPVSPDIDECIKLNDYANSRGVTIVVCHVLRYSKYYMKIKEIISSGEIGDVKTIQHSENIGYFHFAHSYVRGNWHSEKETSPMIMAKCCHDFDILQWLIDKPAVSVSSFGSLDYFKRENAPENCAERCIDCTVKDCKYNAVNLYIKDPLYKCTFLRFNGSIICNKYNYKKNDMYEALKNTNYGKCVFKCDNDVCDHQIVNISYEDGVIASHCVSAFNDKFLRRTNVFGTKGEITADDYTGEIKVRVFGGKHYTIHTKIIKGLGHVDGDINLTRGFIKLCKGEEYDKKDVTFLSETIESHRTAIYAERSRKEGGRVIKMTE